MDRQWNDFPLQPTFLPWIQRWTQYATRGLENISHQDLLVGETFQQNIDRPDAKWAVQTPGGNIHSALTEKGMMKFNKTQLPGIYTIFELPNESTQEAINKLPIGSQPIGTFTINVDTKESSPKKISEDDINTLLPDIKITINKPEPSAYQAASTEGMLLATPLLLLVAGILFLEGWMIRRE